MTLDDVQNALIALGFTTGYAIGNDPAEIISWGNDAPQPTNDELLEALPLGTLICQRKMVEDARRDQYQLLCDPLFFGFQRGDNTEQEWLDAVQAVKDANPYPELPTS